jgi:hypothetical protein
MVKKSEKKSKRNTRGRPINRPVIVSKKNNITTKDVAFRALRNAGVSVKDAKSLLSIGDTTNLRAGTLAQQRESALKALDLTLYSQFATLKEIRDDKNVSCPSDRIHAVKTINTMITGFTAPAELNINNTSVMIEFSALSSQELEEISGSLGDRYKGPIEETSYQVIE